MICEHYAFLQAAVYHRQRGDTVAADAEIPAIVGMVPV
jgi:hypothetical protein